MTRIGKQYLIRTLVGFIIIVFLCFAVELKDLPALNDVSIFYIFLAFLFVLLDRLMNAIRWNILVCSKKLPVTFHVMLKLYFKATFLSLVFPSSVGGEFLKGYGLLKATSKGVDSFSSVIVERILGHIALILICTGTLYIYNDYFTIMPNANTLRIWCLLILMLTILIFPISYLSFRFMDSRTGRTSNRFVLFFIGLWQSFFDYRKHKWQLFLAFLISFGIQCIRVLLTWILGISMGVTFSLSYFFVFVPLAQFASLLPLSIAGLGIEEGALVYFFSLIGASPAKILAMAILSRILNIISVLPGGWLYLREGLGHKFTDKRTLLRENITTALGKMSNQG